MSWTLGQCIQVPLCHKCILVQEAVELIRGIINIDEGVRNAQQDPFPIMYSEDDFNVPPSIAELLPT